MKANIHPIHRIHAILAAAMLVGIASQASAADYVCKVYCQSTSGPTTYVTVQAGSASEAAKIVDTQADRVCRDAGLKDASSKSMSADQCSKK